MLTFRLPAVRRLEAFGLTIDATNGICDYRGPADIHHNRIRHPVRTQIGQAVGVYRNVVHKIHHNIFPQGAGTVICSDTVTSSGARAQPCRDVEVFENVFELTTWPGGWGVGLPGTGIVIRDNRIIARGESPLAILGFDGNVIRNNRIDIMTDMLPRRDAPRRGAVALRVDPSAKALEFKDNLVVVRAACDPELDGPAGSACAVRLPDAARADALLNGNRIVVVPGVKGSEARPFTVQERDDPADSAEPERGAEEAD